LATTRRDARRKKASTPKYLERSLSLDHACVLARAIMLVESNAPAHQKFAQQLLANLPSHTGACVQTDVAYATSQRTRANWDHGDS